MKWRFAGLLIIGLLILSACTGRDIIPSSTDIPSPTPQPKPSSLPAPVPMPTPTPEPDVKPTPTLPPPPASPATSLVLFVGGSGQYRSIQEAINSAQPGATIRVACGTYLESVLINTSKTLTLEGGWDSNFTSRTDDNSLTIIDGQRRHRPISIDADHNVNIEITVDGFTIRNGRHSGGGGIHIQSSGGYIDATLSNNMIMDNMVEPNSGGGVCVVSLDGSTSVTLTKNVIKGNAAPSLDGGGVVAYARYQGQTSISMLNNLITDNEAAFGGGILGYAWGPDGTLNMTLANNIITGNRARYGASIFCCCGKTCPESIPGGSVDWRLTNNTITSNVASEGVGGIQLYSGSTYGDGGLISLSMKNDILWGNLGGGPQLMLTVEPGKSGVTTAEVSYCDIGLVDAHGGGTYTVEHVINEDPLFLDTVNRVFSLQDDSPCIDSGDPNPAFNDGQRPPSKGSVRNDMGAYGGPKNYDWPKQLSLMPGGTPSAVQVPIEPGKGWINLDDFRVIPEKIVTKKIVDDFLIGVGTTDPGGCVSPTVLKDLRANGINYFLPFPSWASIENIQGTYTGTPCPGKSSISWLNGGGATLNGHCLLFLIDEIYAVPRFAFNRAFNDQKEMIEKFVRATVSRFPEIQIWTLNEPVAQNCFGWSREQVYDVFVSASKWIHEVNPEARVMINMIPIQVNWGGLDYEPSQVLTDLLGRGIEADIIGIELYYWWAPEKERDEDGYPQISWIKSGVDIFRKSNLPIIFSEVGIPGMMDGQDQFEKQADWMESFFRFCHDDKDIIGATWYFVRDDTFMPYAGLTNNDYTYRPVGERLLKLANEWNPSTTHSLAGKNYLDLEPGEYDVIVNSEVFRVTVLEGQVVRLGHPN